MTKKKLLPKKEDSQYDFGLALRKLRDEKKIGYELVADTIIVPRSTYRGYEIRGNKIPMEVVMKAADFFKISLDELRIRACLDPNLTIALQNRASRRAAAEPKTEYGSAEDQMKEDVKTLLRLANTILENVRKK